MWTTSRNNNNRVARILWSVWLLWFTSSSSSRIHLVVTACSCLGPITFNNALYRDQDSTAAKVRIMNEIFPNGPLDPIGNGMRYFRATILRPYRGCQLKRGQGILVSTGGNSALCGIDIRTRTDYLLFGFQQKESVKGLGQRTVLQVGSCAHNVPFQDVTKEQQNQLAKFTYVDHCRPAPCDDEQKCGPVPPVAPPTQCPNGSTTFYDINCVVNPQATKQCYWDVRSSSCPTCWEDADCDFNSYCSAGLCRTKDTCGSTDDCWNPSIDPMVWDDNGAPVNDTVTQKKPYSPTTCLAEIRECNSGTCDSTCCPPKDVVACFADPCDVLSVPFHTCVSDFCGGCNAYAYDRAGRRVH